MYRGAAVLFGAEDGAARKSYLELGQPCIGEAPYYLAQRRAGGREEEKERRRRIQDRNLATPTPEGGEQIGRFLCFLYLYVFPHPLVLGLLDFFCEVRSSSPLLLPLSFSSAG